MKKGYWCFFRIPRIKSFSMFSGPMRAMALSFLAACAAWSIGIHPGFELKKLPLEGFNPRVSGLDVLSDGRLVFSTWEGGNYSDRPLNKKAEVYIVDGVQGPNPGNLTVTKAAGPLFDVQGLTIVKDEIFIMQRDNLSKLVDEDGDGKAERIENLVGGWKLSGHYHEFSFGLLHRDGIFYAGLNCNLNGSGNMLADRTSFISMDPAKGSYKILAGGLRTPNGLGFGPEGEVFISDNQGRWRPNSNLMHMETGSWHGYPNVNHSLKDKPFKPPVIQSAHGRMSNSPTQPILVNKGIFKGQMLVGDATMAGLRRYFLEKVKGLWQGVVFRFTGDLNGSGINRLAWGPDGALYMGGIGRPGNWPRPGGTGLQKLVPTGKVIFEMLAVRSRAGGLEIQFTKPVAPEAKDVSKYKAQTWTFKPSAKYGGGNGVDKRGLSVSSAKVSPEGDRVFLALEGMKTGYLIYLVLDDVKSAEGEPLWDNEACYTLNAQSDSKPFAVVNIAEDKARKNPNSYFWNAADRSLFVSAEDPIHLQLYSVTGKLLLSRRMKGPGRVDLSDAVRERGVYRLMLESRVGREFRSIVFY